MATFKTLINKWATGQAGVAKAREVLEQKQGGAYVTLMEAGATWAAEHGTGEDSAKEFRAALTAQQQTVWSKNPEKYGAILTVEIKDDGETVAKLTQPATNAISTVRGAILHGIDLTEEGRTFQATKKEVIALNREARGETVSEEVIAAREVIREELSELRKLVNKMDDCADLDPIQAALAALRIEVKATVDANAKAEADGNKTGKPMSEDDKAKLAELKKASKAPAKARAKAKSRKAA